MFRTLVKSFLLTTAAIAFSSAHATLIDFEQTPFADSSRSESVVYDLGNGRTMTITAFVLTINDGEGNIFDRTQVLDPWGVYLGSTGLGARINSDDSNSLDGSDENSATDFDEGLLFSFNFHAELAAINFGSWNSSDDFNLEVDGVNLMHDVSAFETNAFISSTPENDKFNFRNVTGRDFLIWADGDTDSFRIDDITVYVPEPAAIGLLGLCLLVLSRLRSR